MKINNSIWKICFKYFVKRADVCREASGVFRSDYIAIWRKNQVKSKS